MFCRRQVSEDPFGMFVYLTVHKLEDKPKDARSHLVARLLHQNWELSRPLDHLFLGRAYLDKRVSSLESREVRSACCWCCLSFSLLCRMLQTLFLMPVQKRGNYIEPDSISPSFYIYIYVLTRKHFGLWLLHPN